MANHNDLGRKGEEIAYDYLIKKGYKVLERNYRYKRSEIDLIVLKDNCIAFVEVKTRKNTLFDQPENSVDFKKIEKLQEGALNYIEMNNIMSELRFDIISIILNKEELLINHIENAFWN